MAAPEERAIRSVCVAGGGIVGLSAALAFARALPSAEVTVIEFPSDPASLADRMPSTLPAVGRFHAAIGLDERDLVRAGIATHRLGTRFEHWSADGKPWMHAFGSTGASVGAVPFHKAWLRAWREGRAATFDRHSPAAVLAEADRFVHPDDNPRSPLSTYLYALRLDPPLYRTHLAATCDARGITRIPATLAGVERDGQAGIGALHLSGDRRVAADLFLDCAGPSAPLLSTLDPRFEAWGVWLPCDRLLMAEAPGGPPRPTDRITAASEGWRWAMPLPDRSLAGFAFASALTDDDAAWHALGRDGEAVAIRPGRRPVPWVSNVLALGDSAVALDPLEGANLHLAQSAILRALELLPGRDFHPLELREYARRTEWEALRVRDFLAVHYLRSGRGDGPLWREAAASAPPETLARTLEQFERRGRLPFFEEESFDSESWRAVLLGLGVVPEHVDPAATGVDPDRSAAAIARYGEQVAALPSRLPAYADYLARLSQAPAGPSAAAPAMRPSPNPYRTR